LRAKRINPETAPAKSLDGFVASLLALTLESEWETQ